MTAILLHIKNRMLNYNLKKKLKEIKTFFAVG